MFSNQTLRVILIKNPPFVQIRSLFAMKKSRFLHLTILCILLIASLVLPLAFAGCSVSNCEISVPSQTKNVILIIGDGMGFNHINNAKTFYGIEEFAFEKNYTTEVCTRSKNSLTTDSAAGATALATGNKAKNGEVSFTGGKNLLTITEIANSIGKKTGVLTTDSLTGATPASFSSHSPDRGDDKTIIQGQINSNVNLLLGSKESSNAYLTTYKNAFAEKGYSFGSTLDELASLTNQDKIVATFDSLKSTYNPQLTNQTNFATTVEFALNFLENDNGFFLMIELAHIDKFSHDNDVVGAMSEVRMLFDVLSVVQAFTAERNDTVVMLTADHETGNLSLANNKNEVSNKLYRKSGHSSKNVPLYLYGASIQTQASVENTLVFEIAKTALCQNQ